MASSLVEKEIRCFGVMLDDNKQLLAVHAGIRQPAFESGFSESTPGSAPVRGNSKGGVQALALLLLYAKLARVDTKKEGEKTIVLSGGEGSPAGTFSTILKHEEWSRAGWLYKLLLFEQKLKDPERNAFLARYFESSWDEETGNYCIKVIAPFPKIQVYYKNGRYPNGSIQLRRNENNQRLINLDFPFADGAGSLKHSELGSAAENIISQVTQWFKYKDHSVTISTDDEPELLESPLVQGGGEADFKDEPDLSSLFEKVPFLKKWLRILSGSSQWNSISLLQGGSIPIDQIYTDLYLGDYEEGKALLSKDRQSFFAERSRPHQQKYSLDNILSKMNRRALFVGEPGSGKSTLVKWIASRMCEELMTWRRIPIIVRLRDYVLKVGNKHDLSFLRFFLSTYCHLTKDEESDALKALFELTREEDFTLVFLLDGWDEVPEHLRSHLVMESEYLYDLGHVMITSRPTGFPEIVARRSDVVCKIGALSEPSIRSLVGNLSKHFSRPEKATQILEHIDLNSSLSGISKNPFTLTLLCQLICDESYRIESATNVTELFAQTIEMICREQKSDGYVESLTSLQLEKLRDASKRMCFSPEGKVLYGELALLGYENRGQFDASAIAQSRLLTRELEYDECFTFLHLQVQEYLAGVSLSCADIPELADLLERHGDDWNYIEEWKFLAGSLEPDSPHVETFVTYWRERLKQPDYFGGIYCYAAFVFSEIPLHRRQMLDIGCDLSAQLWENMKRDQWEALSVKALVRYDPFTLSRWVREKPTVVALETVFSQMPVSLQSAVGLQSWASKQCPLSWLRQVAPKVLAAPSGLEEARLILRDKDREISERMEAFRSIAYYEDEQSIEDGISLLDIEDSSNFQRVSNYIAQIGGRRAGMTLAEKVIEVAERDEPAMHQIETLSYGLRSDTYAAIEPHSKEYLLGCLCKRPLKVVTAHAILSALVNCPMGEEARPILQILNDYKNHQLGIIATRALAKCNSHHIQRNTIKCILSVDDISARNKMLDILAAQKNDFGNECYELMNHLENSDLDDDATESILSIITHSHTDFLFRQRFGSYVLHELEELAKSGAVSLAYAYTEAIPRLMPDDRKKGLALLKKLLSAEEVDTLAQTQIALIIGEMGVDGCEDIVCRVLDALPGDLKVDSPEQHLCCVLIRVLLDNHFDLVAQRIQENHVNKELMLKEAREWSEKSLSYCYL